jgi:hypothetical protein
MARYIVTLPSPLSPSEAFAYMANLENFANWDPGVSRSVRKRGNDATVGTTYDVTVTAGTRPTLRYEVLQVEPGKRVLVSARTWALRSVDEISVEPGPHGGSVVTYDAELRLNGPLDLFDRGLGVLFQRLGDKAAKGLRRVLRSDEVT